MGLFYLHPRYIVLILVQEATDPVSEPITQTAVELITNISFQYSKRDKCKTYILFHVKTTTNRFLNDAKMLLKSFCTKFSNEEWTRSLILELIWFTKVNTKRFRWNPPVLILIMITPVSSIDFLCFWRNSWKLVLKKKHGKVANFFFSNSILDFNN